MTDLWLPGAVREPIPQTASDPTIVPVGAVFHIAVTEATSLWHIFTDGRGIESTGYILKDGSVEQYRPLNVQCDAQAAGNSWSEGGRLVGLTSWEAQGDCSTGWTDEQLETIRFIQRILHEDWGTPYRNCPTPTSHGFGYHRMHQEWNPNGHSCPCDSRVRQWENIIEPWWAAGAPITEEATDMQLSDRIGKDGPTVGQVLARLDRFADNSAQREKRILTALTGLGPEIAAAVEQDLRGNAPGLDRAELRQVVEAATVRAINIRLGSLDQPG